MLDFRIKTFICVCQMLNYTQAAKRLNITQPAVSQHIRHIENHYHIKVFRYINKKLELTQAGRILYDRCKTMENDEIALSEELQSTRSELKNLSFGVTMTVGEYAIVVPLAAYLNAHPKINIRLRFGNTQDLLQQLSDGRIQIALVEGYFPSNDYAYEKYSTEDYIGVCSSQHKFIHGTPHTFADLIGERVLIREKGSGTCGISFLYRLAVNRELATGTIKEIPLKNFSMQHDFAFIWEKGSIYTKEYQTICQELRFLKKQEQSV